MAADDYLKTSIAGDGYNVSGDDVNHSKNYFTDANYTDFWYYDYDYEESMTQFNLKELIPNTIFYGLTFLIGMTGNSLVIFSIARYRRMRSIVNIFLVSLASADLLLICICVPVKFAEFFSYTWALGGFMCKCVFYMQDVSVVCSTLTLTFMSVERYIAICHPLEAKYMSTTGRAKIASASIWIAAYALALPTIWVMTHEAAGSGDRMVYWCTEIWKLSDEMKTLHFLYAVYKLCLVFLIPLIIMGFAYASICRELWMVTSHRMSMQGSNNCSTSGSSRPAIASSEQASYSFASKVVVRKPPADDSTRQRKQVIKMLVTVIALFAICWGPTLIEKVLTAAGLVPKLNEGNIRYLRQVFYLMAYSNSCVNPIVYGFMSKNFREIFKYAICVCIKGKRFDLQYVQHKRASCSQTRTTLINNASYKGPVRIEKNELHMYKMQTVVEGDSLIDGSTLNL